MLLRRSVVLVTTLAAALAVSGTAGSAADPGPPPRQVDLAPEVVDHQPLGKTAAREAGAERLPSDARSARPRTKVATADVSAADVSPAVTSAGSKFTSVSPVRVLDTRSGVGAPAGALPTGGVLSLDLSTRVPAEATAVVLNVTGVTPTGSTYITVWPAGETRPVASNVNLRAGEIRPNAVTVGVGMDRSIMFYNNFGNTHVLADLAGYYAPNTGSGFASLISPTRVLDTRTSGGALGPRDTRVIDLSGRVPATATAVTFNLTGVGATSGTYVTAWPTGAPRPTASTLNLVPGEITPNLVTVALGTNRSVSLYNHTGNVHLVADLAGYYATDRGDPFYQISPLRLVDTRAGDPLPGGWIGTIDASPILPSGTNAVVFNLIGTNVTASRTFLTAFASGGDVPTASNLNLTRGQTAANLATVALYDDRRIDVFNQSGDIDFLMDVAGYFASPPYVCPVDCLHSWGDNLFGLLGVGTTGGTSSEPGRVDGLGGVVAATGGELSSYALKSDGTVWSWGIDDGAGLGTGKDWGMSAFPARVSNLTGITQIAAGVHTAYALNSLGQVYSWGYNVNGAMGVGDTANHRVPRRITALGEDVVQVAGGYDTGYALKSDGTVWVWGTNAGSFGNGSYGTGCDTFPVGSGCRSLVPVQVPGLTDVVEIAATWNATFARKSDGTVVAWGWNGNGELGIGTYGGQGCATDVSAPNCVALSPTEVPGLTGVEKIASGGISNSYALRTDGTVLAWGANGPAAGIGTPPFCDVNDPDSCYLTEPTAVPGLTGVVDVVGGGGYGMARRSDGTVWSWGFNSYGQLGVDSGYESSPVQVPGVSGARAIGTSGWTSFAVS